MKLLYRLGFYLAGFSVGIILLSVIFKGKKTSCNYGPNDRVIMNLSKKIWHSTLVNNSTFDSISFDKFLDMASVDFNKSNTKKESSKVNYLDNYWNEKAISLEIEKRKKTVNLLRLNLKSK